MKPDSFITKLANDFNIEITKSNIPIAYENSYWSDRSENIINLDLYNVGLKNLNKLLPISKYLKVLKLREEYNKVATIENIEVIENFTQIEELDLCLNFISSLKGIEKLSSLKKLKLFCTNIKSTKEIGQLNSLRILDLWCENIPITGLENLEYLESLKLNQIDNIEVICEIETLLKLNLENNEINDIKGLERFPNLENLRLFSNPITEVKGLESLKKLKVLSLACTDITEIKGLESLINLEILKLGHTSIPQIKGLETLVNLKQLDLNNYLGESLTPLKKIEGLEHLSKLENLILTGQRIVELKNLPNESLQSLDVSWNKIEYIDYDWLRTLKQPCTINLTGNPVKIILKKIPKHITILTKKSNF